jgi:Fe-S-cluster containining protein
MAGYTIAGQHIELHEPERAAAALDRVYRTFDQRGAAFAATGRNPHLCRAGCSHCCRSGALFAVTLAEAVRLTQAVAAMRAEVATVVLSGAERLLAVQQAHLAVADGGPDRPGERQEEVFAARVADINRTAHPACPLLVDDLCSIYGDRPFLCRAYGFPVDAYAAVSEGAMVFRSLCHLYAEMSLTDYVRARDLRDELASISRALAGGRDVGRFTSAEAILAEFS